MYTVFSLRMRPPSLGGNSSVFTYQLCTRTSYVKVRIINSTCIHAYAGFTFSSSDVLQLSSSCCNPATCFSYQVVVVMYTLLFSIITAVYTWSFSAPAPPRVKVVSGSARQESSVPSRRFREDGLEDLKLPTGGGARVNTHGALAVAN